ncbi:uncharacterized protein LOC134722246 [Mytilus trossulus]|uniref:uncharacterized protein LOC134722246 n=1 Tax=Mytilus trossulus TaxID=6551 RepID=UPI0030074594
MSNWDLEIEAAASEGDNMDETVIAKPDESLQLEDLKKEKAKAKSAFTKTRHSLLQILEEDFPDREEIKVIQEKLINAEEKAMDIMGNLYDKYKHRNDIQNVMKTTKEMEKIEEEFTEAENECRDYLIESKVASSVGSSVSRISKRDNVNSVNKVESKHVTEEKEVKPEFEQTTKEENKNKQLKSELGSDMWKQLKRVSIPIFNGNKRNYQSWKAAFLACIDQAPATKEYKLLQLRQYVEGEALQVIENLGHSAVAYDAAKERLERKYGGQRRQITLYIEELENFKPMREGIAKDIEHFADLLDIAVVNLKEAGRFEELKNGSLYNNLQRKMTESVLSRYHRWIFESGKTESVECLREWILQEAEFQTIASETIHGLSANTSSNSQRNYKGNRRDGFRTFFGESQNESYSGNRMCKYCNGNHGVWKCDEFRKLTVNKRWDTAKRLQLCYRCLGHDHVGRQCPRSRACNLDGCKEVHNRLLHRDKQSFSEPKVPVRTESKTKQNYAAEKKENTDAVTERESRDRTMIGRDRKSNFVTLRTVPVILKNGNRTVSVNALLDDASTKTYINADVAAELGLQGQIQKVTVNVLNDNVETFETMPVEVRLQSHNGQTDAKVVAFTTNRVTGSLQPVDWKQHARKWDHLAGIKFPNLGKRPTVDMLIGLDYPDLHYSYRDIRGKPGEPIARLTPLGWTCIGDPNSGQDQTLFNRTYFARGQENRNNLDNIVRKFWEIENVKTPSENVFLSSDEKKALSKVEQSLEFKDGHYEVKVPWKDDTPSLPNNYNMALSRLANTEKRLNKDPSIAKVYTQTIEKYIEKGYVRKVSTKETVAGKWYLPHFPVIRPDKETTKTRIKVPRCTCL